MKRLAFFLLFCCVACGQGSVVEQTQSGDTTTATTQAPSLNLAPNEKIFVAAAFFTDPVGSIATVGLNNPYTIQKSQAVTDSSDVVIRSFDSKIFVINRGRASTIQVIDPTSFKILGDYSVEAPSNPQALVVVNGKAFISRYDSNLATANKDDLWVVDPITGRLITSINLKPYTTADGEQLARAGEMELVGNFLYVLLEDLSLSFSATTNGKVAVIDTRTNAVVQAIALVGRNPTSIAYNSVLNRLFITDTGLFNANFMTDVNTAYGGIEVINPDTNQTLGILIDDKNFGGYLSSIAMTDTVAAVTVDAEKVALFNPATLAITNLSLYSSASHFIPELLFDKNGLLWIPERDAHITGLFIIDPATGNKIQGPLAVGALPASMALIKQGGIYEQHFNLDQHLGAVAPPLSQRHTGRRGLLGQRSEAQ